MQGDLGAGPTDSLDLASIDTGGSVSLVVGWLSAGKVKLSNVAIAQEVQEAFREVVTDTVSDLTNREAEPWSPEAVVTAETYLVVAVSTLGEMPELARDIAAHGTFASALQNAASLPVLDARRIPGAEMSLYAFVVGDDPDARAVFLRRSNPRRSLRRGRVFAAMHDTLVRVEEPLFGFDALVDMVIVGGGAGVISQTAFGAIFRSNEALAALVPQWVDEVEKTLPFSTEGRAFLLDKARRDSRIRSRLDSIVARGHLAKVSATALREAISGADLHPDDYLSDKDELLVTEENVFDLMHVLNEDLYEGPLSAARFRVDRKQVR
jgi:hypothetical protein